MRVGVILANFNEICRPPVAAILYNFRCLQQYPGLYAIVPEQCNGKDDMNCRSVLV